MRRKICEIILKLIRWLKRSDHAKGIFLLLFLALSSILFSGEEPFNNFIQCHNRNISVKLFRNRSISLRAVVILSFLKFRKIGLTDTLSGLS